MTELRKVSKGFIFSIDALMSIIIMLIILSLVSFYSARAYPETFPLVNLQLKTNDVLVVLDKLGYFSERDGNAISEFVSNSLREGVEWNMTVEYYNAIINGTEVSFTLDRTIELGVENTRSADSASATRIFTVINASNLSYYGRVKLAAWYENQ
mgnify:CR=1 FL=1